MQELIEGPSWLSVLVIQDILLFTQPRTLLLKHRQDSMLIHVLWSMVWLDGQGFERNSIGKLVTRRSGEEVNV